MKKNKVFCKNCSWYKNTYDSISGEFINGGKLRFYSDWGIVHCMHPDCFTHTNVEDIRHGKRKEYTRIKGCHQLNSNFDCPRYKRKFWKFWVE